MQSRIKDIHAAGARVLAICTDSIADNATVSTNLGVGFSILSDPDLSVISSYGLRHEGGNPIEGKDVARPGVFVLDRQGIVQWRSLTDNWRVRVRPETVLKELARIP